MIAAEIHVSKTNIFMNTKRQSLITQIAISAVIILAFCARNNHGQFPSMCDLQRLRCNNAFVTLK